MNKHIPARSLETPRAQTETKPQQSQKKEANHPHVMCSHRIHQVEKAVEQKVNEIYAFGPWI